jgi:elongation factor G
MGNLSFFRVYSGDVSVGSELANVGHGSTERIGQLFSVNGSQREAVKVLHAGDIGAAVKLKNTHTGDNLCSTSRPLELPVVDFPPPNTHGALEAGSKADLNKLGEGLSVLHEEDPTFLWRFDPELGQTIISGQGEIQIQIAAEELKRRFNVDVTTVEPKVPFRETIKGRAESRYRHKKQTGGAGQFAEVWMRIEPLPRETGNQFGHSLVGNNVDRVFVASVEKGVAAACVDGPFAGCPVVDVKADFFDGKQHPVDSKDIAFQIAGKAAFTECFLNAKPCLLEPILELRVTVPSDAVGDVMADISSRRGRVLGVESEGHFEVIIAQVPQAELYRYASQLRALTAGRGSHREKFDHYEEMPPELQAKVVAARKAPANQG